MGTIEEPMTNEIEPYDLELTIKVGSEYLKGKSSLEISRATGVKRAYVERHIMNYKTLMRETAKSNLQVSDRIIVALEETLHHYDVIVKEAWANKEEAEINGDIKSVNAALRLVADLTKVKFGLVQEVSSNTDAELMAELDEMEQEKELVLAVLKGLKAHFPEAFKWVRKELAAAMDDVEVVEVVQ
jgi:hypothetical protein